MAAALTARTRARHTGGGDEKPDLVIRQIGTIEPIRRIDQEEFELAVDQGVGAPSRGGAALILMNLQHSALLHSSETCRCLTVWGSCGTESDKGAFDLYAAGKDDVLAHRVLIASDAPSRS
ncbi:MAG: hypothetical protein K2Y71_24370 [Xanthobacteraceae bacterium]|nr:hypothetical protein [Xanthobacteraceae bacterium]